MKESTPKSGLTAGRKVTMIFTAVIGLLSYGAAMALYGLTLINPWMVAGIGLAMSLATTAPCRRLWNWMWDTQKDWAGMLTHVIATTGLFCAALLALNFFPASRESEHKEKVAVVKVFREKHHQSRRVSRRTWTQGAPYYMYYIRVDVPGSRQKDLSVTHAQYNRLRQGDSVTLTLAKGLLGIPVIKRQGKLVEVPPYRREDYRRPQK